MTKTITVTGGSGFLGSHLISLLRSRGEEVINIDKEPPRGPDKNDQIYEYGNLVTYASRYNHEPPELLIHLGASSWSMVRGKTGWFNDSNKTFLNNALGTYNALLEIKPEKVIFASSANVYGEGRDLKESSRIDISSGYGYSKWIAEEIIRKSGIPHVILRFGTVAGPRGRTFPNRLVWDAVHDNPVELFYKGTARRDIVDVDDICSAIIHARDLSGTYNVATGKEYNSKDLATLIDVIGRSRGYKLNYSLVPMGPPGYVRESTLNIDKIKRTGWAPQYCINEIITKLFNYYEEPGAIEPPTWKDAK